MSPVLATPLLDTVDNPADLRILAPTQLRQLADELRAEMIAAVGETGGHLGSGLGVVDDVQRPGWFVRILDWVYPF